MKRFSLFFAVPFMASAQGVYVSGGVHSAYISEGRNAFDSAVATAEIGSYKMVLYLIYGVPELLTTRVGKRMPVLVTSLLLMRA